MCFQLFVCPRAESWARVKNLLIFPCGEKNVFWLCGISPPMRQSGATVSEQPNFDLTVSRFILLYLIFKEIIKSV